MCYNAGPLDRALRISVGIAVIIYGVTTENMIIAGAGAIPLITGFVGFCPLYMLGRVDTGCSDKD